MIDVLFENSVRSVGEYEVVERKGFGHPDTLCDLIAERCSRLYLKYCAETFDGRYAHHWFDKVMLVGGEAEMGFGHGTLTKPYQVFLVGKAARSIGPYQVPLDSLFQESVKQVLTEVLFEFNFEKWLTLHNLIGDGRGPQNASDRYTPGSRSDLYSPSAFGELVSNDGNLLASYAPLSTLEELVLDLEGFLQSDDVRDAYPFVGRDIKFFGTRDPRGIELQIRLPFIAKNTANYEFYCDALDQIEHVLQRRAELASQSPVFVSVNRKDPKGTAYLTVTGSVADTGDVGVVGRGNRVNGLIAPMRPQSIEAASGKNPIDHTGKLYSLLAQRIANGLWRRIGKEVEVFVRALKHEPIMKPGAVIVRTSTTLSRAEQDICKAIVNDEVNQIGTYLDEIVYRGVSFC